MRGRLEALARLNKSIAPLLGRLEEVLKELVEELRPRLLVVAGSPARGEFVKGMSGVGVLAVQDEEPGQRFALRSVDGVDVEVTCMSLAEVEEALRSGNQFVVETLSQGFVVYGGGEELKELLRRAGLKRATR
mgnify:CR=1 FL=1